MFEFPNLRYFYDNYLSDHTLNFPTIVPSSNSLELYCETDCLVCDTGFSFILDKRKMNQLRSGYNYVMVFVGGNHYCDHDEVEYFNNGEQEIKIPVDYSCNS